VRGKGGVVENVFFENIRMRGIKTDAILFDMYYSGGAPEAEAVKDLTIRKAEAITDSTPQFRNFYVKNIVCNGADRAVVINGLPEMSIKNMVLENVSVESKRGAYIADADGVQINNCRIFPKSGPAFTVIQSRNITINGGRYPIASEVFMKVIGEKSENIRLSGVDLGHVKRVVEIGEGAKSDAVKSD
jgi:DNA sulfur modification protein DndE